MGIRAARTRVEGYRVWVQGPRFGTYNILQYTRVCTIVYIVLYHIVALASGFGLRLHASSAGLSGVQWLSWPVTGLLQILTCEEAEGVLCL